MPCGAVVAIYLSCFCVLCAFMRVCSVFALSEILETSWRVWQNSSRAELSWDAVAASRRVAGTGGRGGCGFPRGCPSVLLPLAASPTWTQQHQSAFLTPRRHAWKLENIPEHDDVARARGSRRAALSATYETTGPAALVNAAPGGAAPFSTRPALAAAPAPGRARPSAARRRPAAATATAPPTSKKKRRRAPGAADDHAGRRGADKRRAPRSPRSSACCSASNGGAATACPTRSTTPRKRRRRTTRGRGRRCHRLGRAAGPVPHRGHGHGLRGVGAGDGPVHEPERGRAGAAAASAAATIPARVRTV